ncbi:MAG: RluA family pseudouridine synthase [Pseudomonadales bacterium]|nr:RluA family pseudouridine synthase [Pseudomonadales bacterium]
MPPPCTEEVDILYEDAHLLVVNKPSGLLSVPGRYVKDCVLNRLIYDYPGVRIVHRLDLDTSGVLVLAHSQLAVSELNRQFRERIVSKQYLAEVFGLPTADYGEVTLPLAPDPVRRPRQRVDVAGKACRTIYEVIQRKSQSALMKLIPVTGRSHQLRVHMKEIGHPILGCDLYAHEAAFQAAERLKLHAASVSLLHPQSGRAMTFEAALKLKEGESDWFAG